METASNGRPMFRLCPTLVNDAQRPLFEQHITEDTCHARQARAYHKCHRCEFLEVRRMSRAVRAITIQA